MRVGSGVLAQQQRTKSKGTCQAWRARLPPMACPPRPDESLTPPVRLLWTEVFCTRLCSEQSDVVATIEYARFGHPECHGYVGGPVGPVAWNGRHLGRLKSWRHGLVVRRLRKAPANRPVARPTSPSRHCFSRWPTVSCTVRDRGGTTRLG